MLKSLLFVQKLKQEIAELDGEEKAMFLEELGIEESGLRSID